MQEQKRTEICDVDFSRNSLDNIYTFFNDGTYERLWDDHMWSINNREGGTLGSFDLGFRETLMKQCKEKDRAVLEELFAKYPATSKR